MEKKRIKICSLEPSHKETWRWGPPLKFLNFATTGVSQMPALREETGCTGRFPSSSLRWRVREAQCCMTPSHLLAQNFYTQLFMLPSHGFQTGILTKLNPRTFKFPSNFSVGFSQITFHILLWPMADNHNAGQVLCIPFASLLFSAYFLLGGIE